MDYLSKFGQFISCFTTIILLFLQFQVSFSQTLEIDPQNTTVNFGSNVVLDCIFPSPVRCMWVKGIGLPVKITGRYRFIKHDGTRDAMDCSIEITNVQESDLGLWACITYSFTPVVAWLSEQKIPSQPKIFFMAEELTELVFPLSANKASATNLSCVSENGNPLPKLYWELDRQSIPGNTQNITIIEGKLFSTYLTWTQGDWSRFGHNKGPLRCILEHPSYERPQAATVNFVMEYATKNVQIQVDGFSGYIFELGHNEKLVLKCTVDGQPKPKITWQFLPEEETKWIVTQNGGDSLVVTEPKYGHYRCTAGNRLNIKGRLVISQELFLKERKMTTETPVLTNFTTFIVLGLLLLMVLILSFMLVCCYCKKKAKTKRIPEPSGAATFTSQRPSDPDPEVHIYNYITTETRSLEEDSGGYLVPAAVNPLLHFYDDIRA